MRILRMVVGGWLILLVAGVSVAQAQQTFPLVDGGTQAVIVTGDLFKQARLAWRYVCDYPPVGAPTAVNTQAERLQGDIEKSTGRKLVIVPEGQYKPEAGQPAIYLGATKKAQELFADRLKGMDTDGYVVHVTPTFVVLAGNVDYAVYDFLSTYLGIDQYIVTELFTITPKHERVVVPVETRVEVPAFYSRAINCFRDGKTWRLHAGVGRYAFHHNIGEKFMVEKQFPGHPEYWALVNGQRVPCTGSRTPNPCVLNPEVIDIVTKYCQDNFGKQPQLLSVSLAMNDSFRYCQCDRCKPLQGKGRSLVVGGKTTNASDYWYTFQNEVARRIQKSHPGKFIGTIAYAHTDNPPTFPVERNILPYICDSSADWGNLEERNRDLERSQVWIDRVDRIGLYEYLYGGAYLVPRLYTRNLADRLRPVGAKCPGSGFYAEVNTGGRGFDGPKLWMAERLLWNPNQDIEALMTRWCTACFGPAAAPMKSYFDSLEAALNKGGARVKPTGILYGYKSEEQFNLYLPEDFPPLWKLLDEARAKAGGDELLLKRIDYFASCLKISDILVQRHHACAEAMELIKKKAAPGEVLAAMLKNEPLWPRVEIWRDIVELQTKDILRVGEGPEGGRVSHMMEYVLEGSAWPAIAERAAKGKPDAAGLRQAAREALDRLVIAGQDADPAAATRLRELREAATRVAAATRTAKPPVIDGNPDEACWTWNGQKPWFMRNTGMPLAGATDFALAYDDRSLYIAVRCGDQDAAEYTRLEQTQGEALKAYGGDTKRTPSVHLFIDLPSGAGDSAPKMPPYQVVPNAFGGLWEKYKAVAAHKTFWNPEKGEWQVEMAIGWENLQVKPAESRLLRLNVVRYMHNLWNRNVGGWYLSREVVRAREAQANERGWLVLE